MKWEYQVLVNVDEQALCELGDAGWELCAVRNTRMASMVVFYLKRPIEEDKQNPVTEIPLPEKCGCEGVRAWLNKQPIPQALNTIEKQCAVCGKWWRREFRMYDGVVESRLVDLFVGL